MATDILGTYSPESVIIVISNDKFQHVINGYADGTFLNITRVIPHATLYTGADATNVRVTRNVTNVDISLTLHQGSESNDVLSRLLRRDEESRNLDEIFQITVRDTSGRFSLSSNSAFIGTPADSGFGADIETRDWTLHAVGSDIHMGGNSKFTNATAGTLADLGQTFDDYWRPVNAAGTSRA